MLKIPSEEIISESIYIVKSGDNLYKIAQQHNTTVDDIKKINNLSSNLLNIGQVLKLTEKEITEENSYIVKSGDNLYKIAQQNNTTVGELMTLNNLSTTALSIGQILKLPVAFDTQEFYIVKSGDSLYKIAQQYNTTVDELIKLNDLSSNLLSIGQKIKIR